MGLYELLTGNYAPSELPAEAVAIVERFKAIRPSLAERDRHADGGYVYDGRRCTAPEVAYRLLQWTSVTETPEEIANGAIDNLIESVWHERAGAEYWYRYEKDWGE